jgi:hypothetical protein
MHLFMFEKHLRLNLNILKHPIIYKYKQEFPRCMNSIISYTSNFCPRLINIFIFIANRNLKKKIKKKKLIK